ncbi:24538_t:CDS:1, partial [Dentiscutata erythropus]
SPGNPRVNFLVDSIQKLDSVTVGKAIYDSHFGVPSSALTVALNEYL